MIQLQSLLKQWDRDLVGMVVEANFEGILVKLHLEEFC